MDVWISALATLLGAALAATVTKYGWTFWRATSVIRCHGSANELQAYREDGHIVESGNDTRYELRDGEFHVRGRRAVFSAHLTITEGDKTLAQGRIAGSGPFFNGWAYLQYHAEDKARNQAWVGLCLLRAPGLGDVVGYWLTEDNLRGGVVAFGDLRLKRD